MARAITIIKLGGSHAFSPTLRDWLDVIARSAGHVVLVPGGGPFADAVRAAQPRMNFDDRAAHRMALLAMEQYGHALASLDDRLVPAADEDAIRHALAAHRVPVWMPDRMASEAPDIATTWDVTSDSLAAWLAVRLGAARLVLVKQVAVDGSIDIAALSASGVVDPALGDTLKGSGVEVAILGPDQFPNTDDVFTLGVIASEVTQSRGPEEKAGLLRRGACRRAGQRPNPSAPRNDGAAADAADVMQDHMPA
jgi:dihydroneopterin aldolase